MNKEVFEEHFEARVAARIAPLGFVSEGGGLSLFDERVTIALFRLGGRMSSPGSISLILCFRHSFLRDMGGKFPRQAPKNVFDYPYKFKPLEDAGRELVYQPRNLSYDYERLRWENVDEASVCQKLDRISANIEDRFVPWAKALSPVTAKAEIAKFGENAWCERSWLQDYLAWG